MDIRLFKEFLVLARLLNFSRAASQLGMSQPVLSRHIKFLEDQLGEKLLDRTTHRVALTGAGNTLARESEKLLSQYDAIFEMFRSVKNQKSMQLSIQFLGDATRAFLPDFIIQFQTKYENIDVIAIETELDEIPDALNQKECDIGIILHPDQYISIPGIERTNLFYDRLTVAVNVKHPLAQREEVSIVEVAQWPLIGIDPVKAPLIAECNAWHLKRYGFGYHPKILCSNLATCYFNLEINEEAVVLLPQHKKGALSSKTRLIPIIEDDCFFCVDLARTSVNQNPAISIFCEELRKFLKDEE